MSVGNYMADVAKQLAASKERQAETLRHEREDLRAKMEKIEQQLSVAQNAAGRASMYPITGGDTICPVCWVNGEQASVRAIGGGTATFDRFRCNGCNQEFQVPFR